MAKCPNCGADVQEGFYFCKKCGAKLPESTITPPPSVTRPSNPNVVAEDAVEQTVIRRFDALKNKDEAAVRALLDDHYYRFDEWPPYQRREAPEALQRELDSIKVITNYNYDLRDMEVNVLGDLAVATFTLHYWGETRNGKFDLHSRATSVLRKQDSGWKVVHEHLSKFPEGTPSPSPFSFGRRLPF